MARRKRILNVKEGLAQSSFNLKLDVPKRKTKNSVIVATIGLVGSGKSSVAQELARHIGATIIRGDDIRVELRKNGSGYERAWVIAENVAIGVAECGGNVILDSDFVDAKKRASVRERARRAGTHLFFVRTTCDFDVMSQRIRENDPGEFFNLATSNSTAKDKGRDVKFREMDRRKPLHYRWINEGGGKWVLKKFPFAIFAEIDTTDFDSWKHKVEQYSKRLIAN